MPDGQECTNGEISSSCGWLVSTFLGNYSRGTVDSRKVLLSPEVSSRRRPAEATDQASAGAPLEPTLRFPEYVIADGRTLYISDVGNSQVLRVSVNASAVPLGPPMPRLGRLASVITITVPRLLALRGPL